MSSKIQPAAAADWLKSNLPAWKVQDEHLVRVYSTPNWQVTLMAANAIGFVAEAADHHPRLILNYSSVEVQLQTHSAGGITAKDYELARKIEETLLWLPGPNDALDAHPGKWIGRADGK